MEQFVTIKNQYLEVTVSKNGGALYSIVDLKDNDQLMWEGEEGLWSARDYVLFPFCCRRVDGYYTHEGVRYDIENHGFARKSVFDVEKQTEDSVTLLLRDNEQTKKVYPFSFALRMIYSLTGKKLTVRYSVENPSDENIYFAFGGHVGMKLVGASGNFVEFDKTMTSRYTLDGMFVRGPIQCDCKKFEVDKNFFRTYDTLMLVSPDKDSALTFTRGDGKKIKFHFSSSVVAFWSEMERGDFACVEPWWGVPDYLPLDREISKKPLITTLEPGEKICEGYEIEI